MIMAEMSSDDTGLFVLQDRHRNYKVDPHLALFALNGTATKESLEQTISSKAVVGINISQLFSEVAEINEALAKVTPYHSVFRNRGDPVRVEQSYQEGCDRAEPLAFENRTIGILLYFCGGQ